MCLSLGGNRLGVFYFLGGTYVQYGKIVKLTRVMHFVYSKKQYIFQPIYFINPFRNRAEPSTGL